MVLVSRVVYTFNREQQLLWQTAVGLYWLAATCQHRQTIPLPLRVRSPGQYRPGAGKLSVPSWHHHGIFINFGFSFSLDYDGKKSGYFLSFFAFIIFSYSFLRKHKVVSINTQNFQVKT